MVGAWLEIPKFGGMGLHRDGFWVCTRAVHTGSITRDYYRKNVSRSSQGGARQSGRVASCKRHLGALIAGEAQDIMGQPVWPDSDLCEAATLGKGRNPSPKEAMQVLRYWLELEGPSCLWPADGVHMVLVWAMWVSVAREQGECPERLYPW